MENFIYQNFTLSGLIVPVVLIILCSFLRVKDCLKSKRGLLISIIISSSVLSINWVFAIALFFGFSLLGIYLESIMPFVPLYLYWAYFILIFIGIIIWVGACSAFWYYMDWYTWDAGERLFDPDFIWKN